MKILSLREVHAKKVEELSLDPALLDLTFPESIAAALRRAAGFLCPCSATSLIRAVLRPLEGLIPDVEGLRETVEDILEALVAHGDLQEHSDISSDQAQRSGRLLYAAPPSFVLRKSGAALILGISPDHPTPFSDELEKQIEYRFHIRRLPSAAADYLRQLGLIELSHDAWLKTPSGEVPDDHVARVGRLLDAAPPSGDVPGLTVLDPSRTVRYYRGRWVEPRAQTGRFVGRRSQAYGADLWCYVELKDGRPLRFIDLPLAGGKHRGCDEAWHLQAAIDTKRGEPQSYRIRQGSTSTTLVDFFSPVPMWAGRRWSAVGEPAASSGCLFSYCFSDSEIHEELNFARERLWLAELTGDSRQKVER